MEWNKTTYSSEELAVLDADELARLLQTQLQKPASELDDDLVRLLLRELEARGKDPALADDTAVEMACEQFRRDTLKNANKKQKWYRSWLITAASVAVVLGILLFTLPGTAVAENVGGVLARWTDSVFQFFAPGQPAYAAEDYVFETDHPGLQQIYDKVVELGITDPIVPMWVPKDYLLQELKDYQMADDYVVVACFENTDKYIVFTIIVHSSEVPLQYEKNEENINVIELKNNKYYIMANDSNNVATWMTNNNECSIAADCSEEEIIRILKSIYSPEV